MTNNKNNGGRSERVTNVPKREESQTKSITSIHVQELKEMGITELIRYAQKLGIPDVGSLRKQEIIFRVWDKLT